jgi:hypothetical protein
MKWMQHTMHHHDKFTMSFLAIISSVTLLRVVGRLVIKYGHYYCTLELYSGFEVTFLHGYGQILEANILNNLH